MKTFQTVEQVEELVAVATSNARQAAEEFFNDKMGGFDGGACGFAWVTLYEYNGKKLDGRSKLGKLLQKSSVRKAYGGGYQLWNPSKMHCQNIDTLEAGANAAAQVFKAAGFTAYAGSRMD
jgi:hypothetical protein